MVKTYKATVIAKERELAAWETAFSEKESRMHVVLSQKDVEITSVPQHVIESQSALDACIQEAITKREEELRVAMMRGEEVAAAMAWREEEIMRAVRTRAEEIFEVWRGREEQIRKEVSEPVEERPKWVKGREEELEAERMRLDGVRAELEVKVKMLDENDKGMFRKFTYRYNCLSYAIGQKDKISLEDVMNILEPLVRMKDTRQRQPKSISGAKPKHAFPGFETPVNRNIAKPPVDYEASAMKGVVFTTTGEALAIPTPAELTNLFINSPRVSLNFTKIFDFEKADEGGEEGSNRAEDKSDAEGPPPSPSIRDCAKSELKSTQQRDSSNSMPPTRLRRPSIRRSWQRPGLPASTSDPTGLSAPAPPTKAFCSKRPSFLAAVPKRSTTVPQPSSPEPEHDFSDEETLPSPFLKRKETNSYAARRAWASTMDQGPE
jgi:hypothetical protein